MLAWKTYFLDDGTIARIDYFSKEQGLYKVSHWNLDPPYDAVLEEHWKTYPGVWCEFATREFPTDECPRVIRSRLYLPGNVLDREYEVHLDDQGKTVRRIRFGPDGRRINEEWPIYDDMGKQIGVNVYNGAGKFLYESLDDD